MLRYAPTIYPSLLRAVSNRNQVRRSASSIQFSIRLAVATSPCSSHRSWVRRRRAVSCLSPAVRPLEIRGPVPWPPEAGRRLGHPSDNERSNRSKSQSQAKPSPIGTYGRARKRPFRYERPTSRIPCIPACGAKRRFTTAQNPCGKPHFLGALQENAVRRNCVVEGAVHVEPVSAFNSLLTGKIQGISGIMTQSPEDSSWT